jgi:hypothetical protein
MGCRTGIDTAGGAGQAVGALDAALTHGISVLVHGLAESQSAVGPAAAGGGKQKGGVLMDAPPGAQFLDHGRGKGNIALFTALAAADQQARGLLASANVFDPNAGSFAHAQAAVVHQAQAGTEARFAHGGQNALDLSTGQDDGQHLGLSNAQLAKDGPASDLEALDKKAEQRIFGHLHGAAGVTFVLAQEQEVLAQLVFGERGRVALKVLSELTDIPDVLFLGRLTVIFKLDVLLEFGDRGIVCFMHKPGRMPSNEDNFPAKLSAAGYATCARIPLPRSGSVQQTHSLDAAMSFSLHIGRHWRGASDVIR